MTVSKKTLQARSQWKPLFELADRIDRLDPWPWMGMADCFGVMVPGWKEPCFAIFGGQSKAFRSVRFLLGWKSFYDFVTRSADPARQVATWLLEIRMIEVLFVSRELLFDHELPVLSALGRKPDDAYTTPMFRSVIPGYHPWLPDEKERGLLEVALYQAFGMAMRVELDGMLLKARFPRELLMRRQDGKGVWQDAWVSVKELGDEEVEVHIESKYLKGVQDKPLKTTTLQIDLVFTPLRLLPEGSRPQTAYVLLAVDAASGFIVSGELLQATEGVANMWAQVPERVLRVFDQLGGCPEAIEVCTDRMANILRPLGEYLPFKMVRREKLAMLDAAREHLSAYFTRPGEKPS